MWCVKRTPPPRPIHPPSPSPLPIVLEALLQQLSPPSPLHSESCICYLQHQCFEQLAAKRDSLMFFFCLSNVAAESKYFKAPDNCFESLNDA